MQLSRSGLRLGREAYPISEGSLGGVVGDFGTRTRLLKCFPIPLWGVRNLSSVFLRRQ